MSDQKNTNGELTPLEEQSLDVLLGEVFGQSYPRDFTDEVLAQLAQLPSSTSPSEIQCEPPVRSPAVVTDTSGKKGIAITLSLIAAIAAIGLIAVAFRPDGAIVDPSDQLAADPGDTPDETAVAVQTPGDIGSESDATAGVPKPPKGIPLVVATPEREETSPETPDLSNPPAPPSRVAMTLVSADVDTDMQKYWQAIGIDPSEDAVAQEIVSRLNNRLGVKLPAGSLSDAEAVRRELARPRIARTVAKQWAGQWTGGGIAKLAQPAQDQLIKQLADSFRSKSGFDRVLAGWTGGEDENMSSFYTAVSGGGEHRMVRRLASLTMNVDLRCVQCHDSMIEGTGQQSDYWSFAALMRHGLKRRQGDWKISDQDISNRSVFYPLLDGRQKAATPGVSSRWIAQTEPIDDVRDWSKSLVGSPALARGVVNSLWTLVHGQPLQGRVVDTVTAPHHESLDQLEQRLAQDLIDSNFDLGRSLALIIASPATRRSVPDALLPENALLAEEGDIEAAMDSVNAFAAVLPNHKRLSLDRRIDIAMQRIGAKIDGVESPILAQGSGDSPAGKGRPPAKSIEKGGDFPGKASSLPVQWLSSIDDQQGRIDHLGYLSGMSRAPEKVTNAVEAIREADDSEELTLQRVWWMLRP